MIICLLIPLSAASASDINNTATDNQVLSATPSVDTLSASVNPEQKNDTLSVNDENLLSAGPDSGSELLTANDNAQSLSELALLIRTNNIVDLYGDYEYKNSDVNLTFSKDVIINGNGYCIDLGNSATIGFTGNVVLNNIVFKNGLSSSSTFSVYGDILTVNDCFFNNFTKGVSANNLTVKNSNFTNPVDKTNALNAILGSSYLEIDNVHIDNWKENITSSGIAYAVVSSSGVAVIKNLTCCNVAAVNAYRPTILSFGNAKAILEDCHFFNTSAPCGIIYVPNSDVTVKNCYFINFTTPYQNDGSAISSYSGDVNIIGCTFENIQSRFGALYIGGMSNIENCIFINNSAIKVGNNNPVSSAISVQGSVNIKNCEFYDHNSFSYPLINIDNNRNVQILNATVKNNNMINLLSSTAADALMIVDGCTITCNTFGNNVIFNIVNKTTFNNTGNTIEDNFNNTGGNLVSFYPTDYVVNPVDLYVGDLWVGLEDKGLANGKDRDNCINISKVLNKLDKNIVLHVVAGTYEGISIITTGTVKGDGKGKTIFNSSSINARNIEDFTVIGKSPTSGAHYTWNNIEVKDISNLNLKFRQSSSIAFYNCDFINVNSTSGIFMDDSVPYNRLLYFENLTFDSCKGNIFNLKGQNSFDIKNITINKHNGGNILYNINKYGYVSTVDDIKVYYSNISCLFDVKGVDLNNVILSNVNITSDYVIGAVGNLYNITLSDVHKQSGSLSTIVNDLNGILEMINITNVSSQKAWDSFNGMSIINTNLTNVIFTNGVITTLTDYSTLDYVNLDNVTGHFIVDGSNIIVSNSVFTKCNNTLLKGGIFEVNTGVNRFNVYNSKFISNNASYGGAFYFNPDCINPVLKNCTFKDNLAEVSGGAIYINSSQPITLSIDDYTNGTLGSIDPFNNLIGNISDVYTVLFIVNDTSDWYPEEGKVYDGKTFKTATSDLSKIGNVAINGRVEFVRFGDIFNNSGISVSQDMLFNDIVILGNNTTIVNYRFEFKEGSFNSEVYNITFMSNPNTAVIVNSTGCIFEYCNFIDNGGSSVESGGALQVLADDLTLKNCSFTNNSALDEINSGIGGAIYVNASNLYIDNCTFDNNSALDGGSHIYLTSDCSNVTIFNSTFKNVPIGYSGGILIQNYRTTVSNCNFTSNGANKGAAMIIRNNAFYITINNCNFTSNTVMSSGGAIYINNIAKSPLFINDNNFTLNDAVNGGALFIDSCPNTDALIFNNNCFNNNSATYGGAAFINCNNIRLENVNFTNNSATYGGAVYINAADVVLSDLNFTGNNATYGGALYVNSTGAKVVNSNFIGNTANVSDSKGSAVYVSKTGGVTFTNVELNDNYVYDEVRSQRGDIFVDGGKFADYGITYGTSPYQQYLSFETIVLTVAYVSQNGGGKGTTLSDPTTLDDALSVIDKSNSIIYLVGGDDLTITNNDALNNLDNVTIVNYNDGKNRKITGNNKYLFNPPKKIKNFSLNNYLSSQLLKIELPRHIDVEDSYFTGQYFPTKVELPCYPPSS